MNKLKTILTLVAIIFVSLIVLSVIGLIYSFASYLLLFGVLCLGAFIAVKLLGKSNARPIPEPDPHQELTKAERLLKEYKQQ